AGAPKRPGMRRCSGPGGIRSGIAGAVVEAARAAGPVVLELAVYLVYQRGSGFVDHRVGQRAGGTGGAHAVQPAAPGAGAPHTAAEVHGRAEAEAQVVGPPHAVGEGSRVVVLDLGDVDLIAAHGVGPLAEHVAHHVHALRIGVPQLAAPVVEDV